MIAQEDDLIVVNKPAGLLAEPPRWREATNLLDLAVARFGPLVLFHRLDRDTSGVILLTRPGPINQYLDHAFKQHAVRKEYVAVVRAPNRLVTTGVIDARLAPDPQRRDKMRVVTRGGQRAVTRYAVERTNGDHQLVRLWPADRPHTPVARASCPFGRAHFGGSTLRSAARCRGTPHVTCGSDQLARGG